MTAHRKIQLFILAAMALLLLIYSSDRLSGVAHDEESIRLTRSKQWVAETRDQLRANQPDIVVLGNSMVDYGFDVALFTELSGRPTMGIWRNGAASAWFYLALKNLILTDSRPRTLIVVFRDNILTRPELRTWGKFKHNIDALVQQESRLLDDLAYLRHKNANYYLSNYLPLYANRSLWSDKLKFAIEDYVSEKMLGIETGELIASLNQMFTLNGIKYREAGNHSYYRSTELDPDNLRFRLNLETSFLPHIVALCQQNGIELIALRFQRLVDLEQLRDTELIEHYIDDFASYANQQGFAFIDSTAANWLERDHYMNNDHLVETGKNRFTREVYRQLKQRELLPAQ